MRSGGFTPQMLIRSTRFKYSTNVSTKHVTRHYAKPLLPAGVLSSVSWRSGLSMVSLSFVNVGCAVAVLKIFKKGRKKLKFLFGWKRGKLFPQTLVSVSAMSGLRDVLDPVRWLIFLSKSISILICPPIQRRYQYRCKN